MVPPPPSKLDLPASPPLKLSVTVADVTDPVSEMISPTPVVITALVSSDVARYSYSTQELGCPQESSVLLVSSDEDKEEDTTPQPSPGRKVRNYTPNYGPYHFGMEPSKLPTVQISPSNRMSVPDTPSGGESSSCSPSASVSPDSEALRAHKAINAFSPQYTQTNPDNLHRFAIDERFQAVMDLPESSLRLAAPGFNRYP